MQNTGSIEFKDTVRQLNVLADLQAMLMDIIACLALDELYTKEMAVADLLKTFNFSHDFQSDFINQLVKDKMNEGDNQIEN